MGIPGEAYRLKFGGKTQLGIGEEGTHTHQGRTYHVKVVNAMQTGCTDDYWRYAYWAVGEP